MIDGPRVRRAITGSSGLVGAFSLARIRPLVAKRGRGSSEVAKWRGARARARLPTKSAPGGPGTGPTKAAAVASSVAMVGERRRRQRRPNSALAPGRAEPIRWAAPARPAQPRGRWRRLKGNRGQRRRRRYRSLARRRHLTSAARSCQVQSSAESQMSLEASASRPWIRLHAPSERARLFRCRRGPRGPECGTIIIITNLLG